MKGANQCKILLTQNVSSLLLHRTGLTKLSCSHHPNPIILKILTKCKKSKQCTTKNLQLCLLERAPHRKSTTKYRII